MPGPALARMDASVALRGLERVAPQVVGLSPDLAVQIGLALLPRNQSPGSLHEGLDLLQGEAAILVGVHCSEDPLVSRLKLLQRDGPVTITVHHREEHPHHHAVTHTPGTTAPSPSREFERSLTARSLGISARYDAVEPVFTMKIAQQLRDIAARIRLDGATAGQRLRCVP
jgi:hypothetical protein